MVRAAVADAEFVDRFITEHVERYFTEEARAALSRCTRALVRGEEIERIEGPALALQVDAVSRSGLECQCAAEFNGTELVVWNLVEPPEGWEAFPSERTPLWYSNGAGVLTPAFDLVGTVHDLLTLGEETCRPLRDKHGRCTGAMSPRAAAGLLEVPVVNNMVAVLMAMVRALEGHADPLSIGDWVRQPELVLSHDADVLFGDEAWTQAMRMWNVASPLLRLKSPRVHEVQHILANYRNPEERYLADIGRMSEAERELGYRSTYYFLNGRRGVYGSRTTNRMIMRGLDQVEAGWDVGMHYNYHTLLDPAAFDRQRVELEELAHCDMVSGRGHFLRFDPERSFDFLSRAGVRVDESVGYPDAIGYRAGLAGAYHPKITDAGSNRIIELPLTVMDGALMRSHPDDPLDAWQRMLRHVARVGGAITLLFHPGTMCNPEWPTIAGIYPQLLRAAHREGYLGVSAVDHVLRRVGQADLSGHRRWRSER